MLFQCLDNFILAPGAERQTSVANTFGGLTMNTNSSNSNNIPIPTTELPTSSQKLQQQQQKADPSKVVMDYSSNFPKLPELAPAPNAGAKGAWGRQPTIQSTLVTDAFKLDANERSSRGSKTFGGNTSDEQQKCNQVAQATGLLFYILLV
jgi:hypothetical protein